MTNRESLPACKSLDQDEATELSKLFKGTIKEFVIVGEKQWFLPKTYAKYCEKYFNFEVRPDDVWQITFPRSGTTWSQEMIWLINNNLDFETARRTPVTLRVNTLEVNAYCDEVVEIYKQEGSHSNTKIDEIMKALEKFRPTLLESTESPRFINSHLPLSLVPNVLKSGCKVVYVARNPKDVLVSLYHFNKDFTSTEFQGDFAQFVEYFLINRVLWTPYFEHVKEGWAQRNNPNFLFLFYEELAEDLRGVIDRVAKFYGKSYTEEQISQLTEHLRFANFKANDSINFAIHSKVFMKNETFIRKGKCHAWQTEFTPELLTKVDRWIEENLKDTDLTFPAPKNR